MIFLQPTVTTTSLSIASPTGEIAPDTNVLYVQIIPLSLTRSS